MSQKSICRSSCAKMVQQVEKNEMNVPYEKRTVYGKKNMLKFSLTMQDHMLGLAD